MKKILITILVVIILIFAFNQYQDYRRFHAPQINYTSQKSIDINYHDKVVLENYYQAVESVNNYVRLQWNTQDIDVRFPEDDDTDTKVAIQEYTKLLGKVKAYEEKLIQSYSLKKQGYSNVDILNFEKSGVYGKEYNEAVKKQFLVTTFQSNPEKYALKVGDYGPFVYELQKVLVKKGYTIPVDGIYRDITAKAVGSFEQKNNLFADGKIDAITLNFLLKG